MPRPRSSGNSTFDYARTFTESYHGVIACFFCSYHNRLFLPAFCIFAITFKIKGFPCNPGNFPYENDGPCGVLALASTLQKAGKKITFLLDEQQISNFTILLDEMCEQELLERPLPEILVPKDKGIYTCMKRLESKLNLFF